MALGAGGEGRRWLWELGERVGYGSRSGREGGMWMWELEETEGYGPGNSLAGEAAEFQWTWGGGGIWVWEMDKHRDMAVRCG